MKQNKALFSVFLTIFIDMLGIGVLFPIYPLLIVDHSPFRITPDTWSIASSFIMFGWLNTAFPLAQFIFAPILGQLADKYGRKKILASSIFGTAVSYLLFAIAIATKSIPLLFFSRILDGCTGGNISVAQAVIADISAPKDRAKNFGLIGMAFGLGVIFGPVIGSRLSDPSIVSWFTPATPFYFTAILSIINMYIVIKFLPETLKIKSIKRIDITRPLHNIKLAFSEPGLRNVMPSTFLFNAGFTFFTTFFAVVMAAKYRFTQSDIGNYFAYIGILIAFAQAVVVRNVAKIAIDYQILRISMFGTAVCLLAFYLIPANLSYFLYFVPPFLSSFNALTMSFNSSLVARVTPENMRGEAFGITSSVMAIAQAIPSILSGYIAGIGTTLPIVVGSITCISAGIVFWLLFNPKQFSNN